MVDSGPTDGAADGSDPCAAGGCTSELVVDPLVFYSGVYPDGVDCTTARVTEVRLFVVQGGTLVRDETTPCGKPVVMRGLPAGPVVVAGLGYFGDVPWYVAGLSIVTGALDAGVRERCACTGFPICDGVALELEPDTTSTMRMILVCDGCIAGFADSCGF